MYYVLLTKSHPSSLAGIYLHILWLQCYSDALANFPNHTTHSRPIGSSNDMDACIHTEMEKYCHTCICF